MHSKLIACSVTYVHHYYPCLYFGILTMGFLLDHLIARLPKSTQFPVFASLYALVIGVFIYFLPIVFGMVGPAADYARLKWFDKWRIYG